MKKGSPEVRTPFAIFDLRRSMICRTPVSPAKKIQRWVVRNEVSLARQRGAEPGPATARERRLTLVFLVGKDGVFDDGVSRTPQTFAHDHNAPLDLLARGQLHARRTRAGRSYTDVRHIVLFLL